MARTPDLERKPALLEQIVDTLTHKPLAHITFRALAESVGVSTFTLVYHFGTREQLLAEIVGAVSTRQTMVMSIVEAQTDQVEDHLDTLRRSWQLSLPTKFRNLQRMEFETAMLEIRTLGKGRLSQAIFERWLNAGVEGLARLGIEGREALLESRLLVDLLYGIHYDLIVNDDIEEANAMFELVAERYESRVREMLAASRGTL